MNRVINDLIQFEVPTVLSHDIGQQIGDGLDRTYLSHLDN